MNLMVMSLIELERLMNDVHFVRCPPNTTPGSWNNTRIGTFDGFDVWCLGKVLMEEENKRAELNKQWEKRVYTEFLKVIGRQDESTESS